MLKQFDELSLLIDGTRCGYFSGRVLFDDDGEPDWIEVWSTLAVTPNVTLYPGHDLWQRFCEAVKFTFASDLDEHCALKPLRAYLDDCDRRNREAREAVA